MTGKTHMIVGVGTATALIHTNDIRTIIGGSILALIGSVLVDIDSAKSKGSKLVKEIFASVFIITLLGLYLQIKHNVNVVGYITGNKSIQEMLPALLLLSIMVVIGKLSPHRSFTHSLIGIVAYTVPIYMLVSSLYMWFLIGYVAHILADTLTKQKVRYLYPFDDKGKYGFCLNLCSANGLVDKLLFFAFSFITATNYLNVIKNYIAML